jgi:hypothetical protein
MDPKSEVQRERGRASVARHKVVSLLLDLRVQQREVLVGTTEDVPILASVDRVTYIAENIYPMKHSSP